MDLDDWNALDEQARDTIRALRDLVECFDNDGLPQEVFEATYDLLTVQMGPQAGADFSRGIDATDDQFYFKNADARQLTVQKIFGE